MLDRRNVCVLYEIRWILDSYTRHRREDNHGHDDFVHVKTAYFNCLDYVIGYNEKSRHNRHSHSYYYIENDDDSAVGHSIQ